MKENIVDSMSEISLTPADFITLMFERTDEDGILYIPGWHYDDPGWEYNAPGSTDENDSYRCLVNWNLAKYEKLLDKFVKHYAMLEKIAAHWDELDGTPETAKNILRDSALFTCWSTFIRPFEIGDIDKEKINDINDRLDTIEWVKFIASRVAKGDSVEAFEKEALSEYIDVAVANEERDYRKAYFERIDKDAEMRVGKGICAHDVIIRSKRLCRLMSLQAPQIVVYNEARQLAAAMLLHDYGISREIVDNHIRLRLEELEMMSDDELDELSRPKKTNTRKSLAPLFVHSILKEKSNSKKHLRQPDILKELEKYPYEITLERKALSRIIHNLIDTPQYAVFSDKTGVWVEQE